MRSLIACVALAGCATVSTLTPPERLTGCWVNRDAGAVTMRWAEDPARPGFLLGSKTTFGLGANVMERYLLEPVGAEWRLCQRLAGPATPRCWGVAHGDGGSLEGGRVFIDGGGDNVRVAVMGDGPERVIFQGRRENCR